MRFENNGPEIPDLLLERRDQGKVVFLCGAGVSLNYGMPTFQELTTQVIDFFDPPIDSLLESSFALWRNNKDGPKTPLDQIFNILHQEYGIEEVNSHVSKILWDRYSDKKNIIEHKIISKISSDIDGSPQIVTTNFDHLFEKINRNAKINTYEPPALPEIELKMPISGVTYLHGRLQKESERNHPYILSSADFGRAYLAEGWATNFIRSLLNRYTVVLVGYRAEDPLVNYLLQGLNHEESFNKSNLYAFEKGNIDEIKDKWIDRGVTGIAYKEHKKLWTSLKLWADRATNPRKWREKVVKLAMRNPKNLAPFERGKVAHIVRTTAGSRLFSSIEPSPSTEWLCVFDATCRAGKIVTDHYSNSETYDPLEIYGLDTDPPRATEILQSDKFRYDQILEWNNKEVNPTTLDNLNDRRYLSYVEIPKRLLHLSTWISNNINSPITAWWVARSTNLHPTLTRLIDNKLRNDNGINPKALKIWNLLLEIQSNKCEDIFGHEWIYLENRVKNEGWTPSVLRDYDVKLAPKIVSKTHVGIRESIPPLKNWDNTKQSEIVHFEIKFPEKHNIELIPPDDVLDQIFHISERHLLLYSQLLEATNNYIYENLTCYPVPDFSLNSYHNFNLAPFLDLFSRARKLLPEVTKARVQTWPINEKHIFRQLILFALNHRDLFSPREVEEQILTLSDECFWDSNIKRELLFLINNRWDEFFNSTKIKIVDRLLKGSIKQPNSTYKNFKKNKNLDACYYTKWLTLQGKVITLSQTNKLNKKISKIVDWDEELAQNFTTGHFGYSRSKSIVIDESCNEISSLPINEIVSYAKNYSNYDFQTSTQTKPFKGLVKDNPRKALSALSLSATKVSAQ